MCVCVCGWVWVCVCMSVCACVCVSLRHYIDIVGLAISNRREVAPQLNQGILKGGSITVPLTSCLTGLESAVWQLTISVFICKTDLSKPVKQEVYGTVILPPLVFPGWTYTGPKAEFSPLFWPLSSLRFFS
jgi:hypothetical protein